MKQVLEAIKEMREVITEGFRMCSLPNDALKAELQKIN